MITKVERSKCAQRFDVCIVPYSLGSRAVPATKHIRRFAAGSDYVTTHSTKWIRVPSQITYQYYEL